MAGILLLDQYAGLGGGQRILIDLASAFRRRVGDVSIMVPGGGVAKKRLVGDGFDVHPLSLKAMTPGKKPLREKFSYFPSARLAAREIEAVVKEKRPQLIYANAPRCFLPAVLAGNRTGTPVVPALHLIFTAGMERKLVRWCCSRRIVKKVICCSDAVVDSLGQKLRSKAEKLHYWVSPPFLEEESRREASRRNLGLEESDVAAGVLGRISKTKGQLLFVEALGPLLESNPSLRLFVAGASDFEDSEEDGRVREKASSFRDSERITITGKMIDALPFLDAMDVLVVPSQWEEPFGLVAVEGMARNLPVVVTRSGGLVEIVEHGVTGYHADKSADSIRNATLPLLEDNELRLTMGQAARNRVEMCFNPGVQLERLMETALG